MDKDKLLELFAHHVSAFDALTNVVGVLLLATPIPAAERDAAQLLINDAKAYVDKAAAAVDAASAAAEPEEPPPAPQAEAQGQQAQETGV